MLYFGPKSSIFSAWAMKSCTFYCKVTFKIAYQYYLLPLYVIDLIVIVPCISSVVVCFRLLMCVVPSPWLRELLIDCGES